MIKSIVTDKKLLSEESFPIVVCPEALVIVDQVITDLVDTANKYRKLPIGCAGLAANQIGHLHRIFIVWNGADWLPMVNPIIKLRGDKTDWQTEGCLSRPNILVKMKRHKKIKVTYLNEKLEPITRNFNQFIARVIQHENDHLNGVYI